MKWITLPIAAMAALTGGPMRPATAQDATTKDVCAALGYLAETIMQERQNGGTMSDMMARLEGADAPEPFKEFARAAMIDAFAAPRFSSDGERARIVTDFRNSAELLCYRGL